MAYTGEIIGGEYLTQATTLATAFPDPRLPAHEAFMQQRNVPYDIWSGTTSLGQFSKNPGCTPKYALNQGPRDPEDRETMARLFIQMPQQERNLFVQSLPPETRPLGKILCGAGTGAAGGTGFIDFLLTSVSEQFEEKCQIVESLSDNFVAYLFGQRAVPFQYSGVVLNTYQDDQRVWMNRIYRDIARGTQLARRRKLIRLRYDSVIVSGILLSMQQTLKGEDVDWGQFAFTLLPMQYVIFSPAIGAPTQLETGFTEGAQYGLDMTKVPDTRKLRSSSPTRGVRSKSKPAAEVTTSHSDKALEKIRANPKRAKDHLKDRAQKPKKILGTTSVETNFYKGGLQTL